MADLLYELRLEDLIARVSSWRRAADEAKQKWWFVPLGVIYFFYFTVPWAVLTWLWSWLALFLTVLCRRSKHAKQIAMHLAAMGDALRRMTKTHRAAKVGDLLRVCQQIAVEFVQSVRRQAVPSSKDPRRKGGKHVGGMAAATARSIAELTELLAYEEVDEPAATELSGARQRAHRVMHHVIPTNPFRATVRRRTPFQPLTPGTATNTAAAAAPEADAVSLFSSISNRWDADVADALSIPEEVVYSAEKDSPTSFPTTPFSRARIMHRSAERTDTVMFAARDRLRLEAQSASRDEYSRNAALEAASSGQVRV